jgi:MtrB/PioB family decaheme-associated outer membrane protein
MRKAIVSAALVLACAGTVAAQDPPSLPLPTDPVGVGRSEFTGRWYGTFDLGARVSTVEGDEARFQRYRDLRSGIFGHNAVAGRRTRDWTLETQAWNIGYRDQRYQIDLQRVGRLTGYFQYDQIPLFISADTTTLYAETSPGVFRIEDSVQQQNQSGATTLHDYETQATPFELRTMRRVGTGEVLFNATPNTDVSVYIRNTNREGHIPFGGTFGFSNAVEIPAPLDTRTTDLRATVQWANTRGMLRVGWDASAFKNDLDAVVWDNPLVFSDSTSSPSQGRLASWPGNSLNYLHGTGSITLPRRGRLTGYLAFGQGRQEESLVPFTINTALVQPPLARSETQAKSQMTVAQLTFAMRPAPRLAVNARYRHADSDIETPLFDRSQGSVSYDTKQVTSTSASEYHSTARTSFDVDAAFELFPAASLKVGYSNLGSDYTHRIFQTTDENVLRASIDTTGNQYVNVRAQYEGRQRDGNSFDPDALDAVGEIPDMRHFDVADRNRRRLTLIVNATPGQIFGFSASAGVGRDEYEDSGHGLQNFDSDQYSLGFNVAPGDAYEFAASYGWENYNSMQRSRYAGSDAELADPARDWTTDYEGKVNFVESSLNVNGAIERTLLRFWGDWNKSNDTYLYGLVTGSPLAVPEQLPPVKNELLRAGVDLTYELSRNLHLGAAYWFDDYNVEDFALGPTTLSGIALPAIEPGESEPATNALLLGYLYRPYTAHVGFVRLTYGW